MKFDCFWVGNRVEFDLTSLHEQRDTSVGVGGWPQNKMLYPHGKRTIESKNFPMIWKLNFWAANDIDLITDDTKRYKGMSRDFQPMVCAILLVNNIIGYGILGPVEVRSQLDPSSGVKAVVEHGAWLPANWEFNI